MRCCCNSVCQVGNAVRLLHLMLTFFVFYVLLTNPHSELHQAWQRHTGFFVAVVVLLSVSLLLYLLASFIDPGYLPKADPPPLSSSYQPSPQTPPSPTKPSSEPPTDPAHLELSLDIATDSDPQSSGAERFCRVCNIPQPLRAKHCYQCSRCVRRFDHHCPWLGNCVAERNHRFFWMFLGCETVLLAIGVWTSWGAISISGSRHWLGDNILVFVCLLLVFVMAIVCGLLFLYHSYLMLTAQTTWEQASRSRISYLKDLQDLSNPFDEGCCCNIAHFICCWSRNWEAVYSSSRTRYSKVRDSS